MTTKAAEILKVAEECFSLANEPGYRSCISRAYYGMFHETMSCLQSVPDYSSNHHSNLIGYMTTPAENKSEPFNSKTLKILGYNLRQMRDSRNEADYNLSDVTISQEVAQSVLESAKLYFEKWRNLRS